MKMIEEVDVGTITYFLLFMLFSLFRKRGKDLLV